MCRVIDEIAISMEWLGHNPELVEHYGCNGVVAVLDPKDIATAPDFCDVQVSVRRPDGSRHVLAASFPERRCDMVGLFFQGVERGAIPRGSQVSW